MSKPYSETDLSQQITEDRTWRIREISDLKSAAKTSDQALSRVLLRALVAVCYSHWEGHVRFSAQRFLEHISLRKFGYHELDRQHYRNYFLPRLAAISTNRANIKDRCALIDAILDSSEMRFAHVNEDLINTRSNLNFEVFSDICLICGVDLEEFKRSESFVDVFLLKRRNAIAHGEDTFVAVSDLDKLADETIALMRQFGDSLDNRAVLKQYRATA